MELNQYSHLTFEEYSDYVKNGGFEQVNLRGEARQLHAVPQNIAGLPNSVYWSLTGLLLL